MFGGPDVPGGFAQRAGSDNDGVGEGAQDAHHYEVVCIVAADVAPSCSPRLFKRNHTVQRGDKVGEDVGPAGLHRKA